jgi:cytochrome P450
VQQPNRPGDRSLSKPSLDRIDYADPFPTYRDLQDEDPVHWWKAKNAWIVTRYADVSQCLRSADTSAERDGGRFSGFTNAQLDEVGRLRDFYRNWPLFSDPPRHTRTRRLASSALSRSLTAGQKSAIALSIEERTRLLAEGRSACDAMPAYAEPLATQAMGSLFDLPHDVFVRIGELSAPIVDYIGLAAPDYDRALLAVQALDELEGHLAPLIEERRSTDRSDIITQVGHLATSCGCDNDEAIAVCINLLVDGHEPIASAIGAGILDLAAHDSDDRPEELPELYVEHVLRLASPFQYISRTVLRPIEVAGQVIPAGDRVLLMIGAANRDPAVFPDASALKAHGSGYRHLAFGAGVHSCPGAPTARFVVTEALRSFAARMGHARLGGGGVTWRQSLGYRSPVSIDLMW